MALEITRTAKVYRLWLDAEMRECFEDLAADGWTCVLACSGKKNSTTVEWAVNLGRQRVNHVTSLLDVVVSDGVTVEPSALRDFNRKYPDNRITV